MKSECGMSYERIDKDAGHTVLTWDTGSKLLRKLGYQVIVDPVLHRAQNDHGTSIIHCKVTVNLFRVFYEQI